MRRTILLLITVALALLLAGGVAASKQQQESTSKSPTANPNTSGNDASVESTTSQASFSSGSDATFLHVAVSDHGNLLSFESPAGEEAVNAGNEGYAVCFNSVGVSAFDTGSVEGLFGSATISQPNGAGTFPLTVTRDTNDGKFRLKQVWNTPDKTEKDVTVAMTLKNLTSSTISGVVISRSGDFDVGTSSSDRGATSGDSAWQWDDAVGSTDKPPAGFMITALTFGMSHKPSIETQGGWDAPISPGRHQCVASFSSEPTPTAEGNYVMRLNYSLGALTAGQSKTVKIEYSRM